MSVFPSATNRRPRSLSTPATPDRVFVDDDADVVEAIARHRALQGQLDDLDGEIEAAPGPRMSRNAIEAEAAALLAGQPLSDRPRVDLEELSRKRAIVERAVKLAGDAVEAARRAAKPRIRADHVAEQTEIVERVRSSAGPFIEALRELWTFNWRLEEAGPYGAPLMAVTVGPAATTDGLSVLIQQLEKFPEEFHQTEEGATHFAKGERR